MAQCSLCSQEITEFDWDHGRVTVAGDCSVVDDSGAVLHLGCYQDERARFKPERSKAARRKKAAVK